jgi:hypothetical protein
MPVLLTDVLLSRSIMWGEAIGEMVVEEEHLHESVWLIW